MSEYDFPDFESPTDSAANRKLPFGLSMQALSMILLILALLGVLWLFFGPSPDSPTGLATATPRPVDTLTEADSAATAAAASKAPTSSSSSGGASAVGDAATAAPAATTLAGAATADLGADADEDAGAGSSASAGAGAGSGTPAATGQSAASASTPAAIAANGFVKVIDTDGYGLRLRFGAGLDYVTIRIVDDGEVLRVTGGPESGDGQRWYRLQDALGNVGWGAEEFITPAASPPLWSPPIASPTFPASEDGSSAP